VRTNQIVDCMQRQGGIVELNERDVVFCCVRWEMEVENRFVEGFILMNRRLSKIHSSDVPGWTSPRRKLVYCLL
jgi:hypothetical protein